MLKIFLKFFMIVGGLYIVPMISFGQINFDMPYTLSSEVSAEIIPNYPRPNDLTSISLTLYTEDLSSADISWYKDGKLMDQGKGKTSYSFTTGPSGEGVKIEAKIKLLSGVSFSKIINLSPASVDLVWEAQSYVPPFYKGKALHSRQGVVKVVAMPEFVNNGKRIPPENLIYEWSNGNQVYQSQSGYGKNSIILNGSILGRAENVSVLVKSPDNSLVAEGFVNISPVEPEIVFYENDPYYGYIFDTAVQNPFDLKGDEIEISAAPYYFSKESGFGLKYEWRLNGSLIASLSDSKTAIFKKPEGEAGKSTISLQMQNNNRILQQASKSITMTFIKN